mmetsp:Transcript_2071/g.6720  ORF Transcript_2071/g.6720 Transcript_2071/m.6720 type:complete len:310 (+) Transcript_2071:513-1442(+)
MPRGRRGPFRENGVRRPLWRRRSRAEPRRRAAPRVRGRGGGRRGHAQDAGRRLLEGGDAGSREERRPPHGLLATRRAPRGAEEPAALPWGHHGLRAVAADQGSHGDASLEAHEGGKRDRAARDVQRLAPRGAGLADGKRHFCAASGDGSRRRRSQRRVLQRGPQLAREAGAVFRSAQSPRSDGICLHQADRGDVRDRDQRRGAREQLGRGRRAAGGADVRGTAPGRPGVRVRVGGVPQRPGHGGWGLAGGRGSRRARRGGREPQAARARRGTCARRHLAQPRRRGRRPPEARRGHPRYGPAESPRRGLG